MIATPFIMSCCHFNCLVVLLSSEDIRVQMYRNHCTLHQIFLQNNSYNYVYKLASQLYMQMHGSAIAGPQQCYSYISLIIKLNMSKRDLVLLVVWVCQLVKMSQFQLPTVHNTGCHSKHNQLQLLLVIMYMHA